MNQTHTEQDFKDIYKGTVKDGWECWEKCRMKDLKEGDIFLTIEGEAGQTWEAATDPYPADLNSGKPLELPVTFNREYVNWGIKVRPVESD